VTPEQRDRAAKLLVEAATDGDKAVAERHGVTVRSLQRYRKALVRDEELSRAVADKKAKVEAGWADQIPGALRAAIAFLQKAAEQADPKDPAAIHSVAGAMKLLSETSATWKVLDARLARQNRPVQQADGTPPAAGGGSNSGTAARPAAN